MNINNIRYILYTINVVRMKFEHSKKTLQKLLSEVVYPAAADPGGTGPRVPPVKI